MEKKEGDHNFRKSPRADSFVDDLDTSDDVMEEESIFDRDGDTVISTDATEVNDDDDAIIKCICGYAKGYDDDDATACDVCGTWQHHLCYFQIMGRPIPSENQSFRCVDCGPTHQVDAKLARSRMTKKVRTLATLADRISELRAEVMARDAELAQLDLEIAFVEGELYTQGPLLDVLASNDDQEAKDLLDWMHEDWCSFTYQRWENGRRRFETLGRIEELEEDYSLVRRNEPTFEESQKIAQAKRDAAPKLWTTASSMGNIPCYHWSLPPVLQGMSKLELKDVAINGGEVAEKPAKKKKKARTRR